MLSALRTITIAIALLALPNAAFAAKTAKVCVTDKGEIFVRSKCLKNEKILSAPVLNSLISSDIAAAGAPGEQGVVGVTGIKGPIGPQGPLGPQGIAGIQGIKGLIDFSGCRQVAGGSSNILLPSQTLVTTSVFCDPSFEFLLNDEFVTLPFGNSAGSKIFIQNRSTETQTIAGDTKEYGVTYTSNRLTSVGSGIYVLNIKGLCCPR